MTGNRRLSAVILTFNSSASITRTIRAILPLTTTIHVVDSYSQDNTLEICREFGCQIVQHPFENYAAQRNWAIDTLDLPGEWQLHVDADEELTPDLQRAIAAIDLSDPYTDGYILGRKLVFMGQTLRFGGIAKTWHYRLFRRGFGRCEDRLYDQHFVSTGNVRRIKAFMLDHQEMTLSDWTARHNRWSDAEAAEIGVEYPRSPSKRQIVPSMGGDAIARRRYAKQTYYRLPMFWRAAAYAIYRYILCGGFLDGKRGFIYHMLQGFWFRLLVDAKLFEMEQKDG